MLQKVYGQASLQEFEAFLKAIGGDLDVRFAGLHTVESGWAGVQVSGPDERIALRLLDREAGLAPASLEHVKRFSVYRGRIVQSKRSRVDALVDVGVFSPTPVFARVPLHRLQAQLADGRKLALQKLVELFVLLDNFPLEVRITRVEEDALEAELVERQVRSFDSWAKMGLDRLVVLGALADEVARAVKQARIEGDILRVESMGFLEHSVVCKLGTDGVGLVPRLGRQLTRAVLGIFSPRRLFNVLNQRFIAYENRAAD